MAAGTEKGHGPAGWARLRADGRLRATRSEGEAAGRGSPSSCWCRRGAGGWRPRRAAGTRGFNRKLHTSPRRPAHSPGLGLRPDLRAASSRRRRRRRRRRRLCCGPAGEVGDAGCRCPARARGTRAGSVCWGGGGRVGQDGWSEQERRRRRAPSRRPLPPPAPPPGAGRGQLQAEAPGTSRAFLPPQAASRLRKHWRR